jgi:hypothetical protein
MTQEINEKKEFRKRSNTVPIRPIEFKRTRSDSFHVGTTPTNTPLTPLLKGLSSSCSDDNIKNENKKDAEEFHVGSFILGSKFSSTKLFEMDRL